MKADPVWRALRILVPCVAVLTARASPAARRSATELEQDTAEDPCSAEQGKQYYLNNSVEDNCKVFEEL